MTDRKNSKYNVGADVLDGEDSPLERKRPDGKRHNRQFFATLPTKEFAAKVVEKFTQHQRYLEGSSLHQRIIEALAEHYSIDPFFGHQLTSGHRRAGKNGELIVSNLNEFRNVVEKTIAAALKNEPRWQPNPNNTDYGALVAASIARKALEQYRKTSGLPNMARDVIERCLLMAAGYIYMPWDATAGDPLPFDGGPLRYQGDFTPEVHDLYSVAQAKYGDPQNPRWSIIKRRGSIHDLAARYPEKAKQIFERGTFFETALDDATDNWVLSESFGDEEDCETCDWFEVYVNRCEAMPAGAFAVVLDEETVLYESRGERKVGGQDVLLGIPYERVPLFRLVQAEMVRGHLPYAPSHDWLGPVKRLQAADGRVSTLLDGKMNVMCIPPGATYDESDIRHMAKITASPDMFPKDITLGGPDGNDLNMVKYFQEQVQRLANLSDADFGQHKSGDSGKLVAALKESKESFAGKFGARVIVFWEEIGAHIVSTLAHRCSPQRILEIAGVRQETEVAAFTSDKMRAVARVSVEISGDDHMQLAMQLAQLGLIPQGDMDTFMLVARDGLADIGSEATEEANRVIRRENEMLLMGDNTEVAATPADIHKEHLFGPDGHLRLLSSSEVRSDPEKFDIIMEHCMQHVQALKPNGALFNADLLLLTGQEPLPPTPNDPVGQDNMPMGVPGEGTTESAAAAAGGGATGGPPQGGPGAGNPVGDAGPMPLPDLPKARGPQMAPP